MKNGQLKIVAGILALSFVAATAPASAGLEAASAAASTGVEKAATSLIGQVKKFLKEQKRRIKQGETVRQCPEGTHPSQEGELGVVCRSDQPASVTCEVLGYEKVTDESGTYYRAILGKCTSSWGGTGGWAGDGNNPLDNAPQAP